MVFKNNSCGYIEDFVLFHEHHLSKCLDFVTLQRSTCARPIHVEMEQVAVTEELIITVHALQDIQGKTAKQVRIHTAPKAKNNSSR